MPTMDIFHNDAFSAASLLKAVEKFEYVPQFLGSLEVGGLPLFEPEPVRTTVVAIEQRDNTLALVPTSPRGAPPTQKAKDPRNIRNFNTVRIAPSDRLMADEIQNIRAFGSETELMQVQEEVARRLYRLRLDIELTHEYQRLGAVMGKVYDADGATLIYNYFSEFGIAEPSEIDFDLDNANPAPGAVRKKCTQVVRNITRALGSLAVPTMQVIGLCGDAFWDDLTSHPEVRETYLNYEAAAALREGVAWSEFFYGGIRFVNYRGTDDNSKVAVGTDKCAFFPAGAPGVFKMAFAPAETFEWVNTPGREAYPMIVVDKDRQMWADIELYSYPLPICTRPAALQRAKRT